MFVIAKRRHWRILRTGGRRPFSFLGTQRNCPGDATARGDGTCCCGFQRAFPPQRKIRRGLLRCYISRVENDHTVPSVDTLEKMARALEVPMYRLFTDEANVKKPNLPTESIRSWKVNPKQQREVRAFAKCLSRMRVKDRGLLIHIASKTANRA
jgi:hypothetical protein